MKMEATVDPRFWWWLSRASGIVAWLVVRADRSKTCNAVRIRTTAACRSSAVSASSPATCTRRPPARRVNVTVGGDDSTGGTGGREGDAYAAFALPPDRVGDPADEVRQFRNGSRPLSG
jgi:hypothetical protein